MDVSLKDYFMNWHNSEKNRKYHFDYVCDPIKKLSKVNLYQAGELIVNNSYEIRKHIQVCNEISYVVEGCCDFYSDGKVFHAKKGDIHIASKGTYHRIVVNQGETLRMAYLGFDFREDDNTDLKRFYLNNPSQIFNDLYWCPKKFELLLNEIYAEQDFAIDVIDACVTEILIHIYRVFMCGGSDEIKRIVEDSRLEKTVGVAVMKVIRYIDQNIEQVSSVARIADELKYNRSYLSRIFSEKMNISIHQYIDERKIAAAKRLMEEGANVRETAVRLGYSCPQSLWKVFLRCEGYSPSEFLKKIKVE